MAKKLEFGNYTLKFGEQKVLLDLYDEVVFPSFLEMKYKRKIKNKGEFFFLDTEVIKLVDDKDEPVVGISGRIVKNTKLRREQIFRGQGLVEDHEELETAPSSTFLLILNNHRLIFCKEVPGAPTISNFCSTSAHFIKTAHQEFIEAQFDEAKAAKELNPDLERVTKISLVDKYPRPDLRITPLTDTEDLRHFVNRFAQIDKLSIKLLPTNREEIDNDDFWRDFGRRKDKMNSPTTRVEFYNNGDGLDLEAVYEETSSATSFGNSEISIKGHNGDGDTLKGDNTDFDLSVEMDEMPREPKQAAAAKYQVFMNLADQGTITLPALAAEVIDKIKLIFDRL